MSAPPSPRPSRSSASRWPGRTSSSSPSPASPSARRSWTRTRPGPGCCRRRAERRRRMSPSSTVPVGSVDQDEYRRLSDLLAVGLAVASTRQGPHDVAVTVDSYLDLSYDPPTMLIALYGMSRAAEAVEEAGHFCLTLLAADQQALADRFGTPGAPLQGMLSGLEVTRTSDGDAILPDGLAHFAIRVEQAVDAATHRLLIGPVVEMGEGRLAAEPAVRFAGEKRPLR